MKTAFEHLPEAEFETPHGKIRGSVIELYVGLRGQNRVAFADGMGRVYHYNTDEVAPVGDDVLVYAKTPMDPQHVMVRVIKEPLLEPPPNSETRMELVA